MNDLIARVYERVILRHPVIVLLLMGLVLVACARGMANFKLDASADALLLENDQALRDFRQMSMRYRTRDFLFIAVVPPGDFLSPENRELVTRLRAVADERQSDKIYLRADGAIPYARVMEVMGALNAAGFNNIVLVTEAGGPRMDADG